MKLKTRVLGTISRIRRPFFIMKPAALISHVGLSNDQSGPKILDHRAVKAILTPNLLQVTLLSGVLPFPTAVWLFLMLVVYCCFAMI